MNNFCLIKGMKIIKFIFDDAIFVSFDIFNKLKSSKLITSV